MKKIPLTIITILAFVSQCFGQNSTAVASEQVIAAIAKDTTLNLHDYAPNLSATKRDVPWFVEKFKFSAGFFLSLNNTNISVNSSDGTKGTDIDFENDLGFNSNSKTFLADFQWRSSSRSRFDLTYFGLHRSSDYTLQRTINFGDHTYDVNAAVSAFFNTDIYRFSYGYAIFSKPDFEAGLLVGAHIVKVSTGLALTGNNVTVGANSDYKVTAPVPDFGLWGGYTFSPRWAVNAEADYLAVTISNIYGRILAYNLLATYKVASNFDLALGFTGLNIKVDATKQNRVGELKWGYNGPTLTATFSFGQKSWQ